MPTLDEALLLFQQAPNMLINIEVKAPNENLALLEKYDFKEACAIVKEHLVRHKVQHRTIISSFCPLVTKQMQQIDRARNIQILQLLDYGGK